MTPLIECSHCLETKPWGEFRSKRQNPARMVTPICRACESVSNRHTTLWKYKITVRDFNYLRDDQGHKCKICKTHESELSRGLVVDHSHSTGKVRGLLCHECNTGLGMFKESITTILNAVEYLKESNGV